jgi:hypothetical protein
MRNLWKKFNELVFGQIAILFFALVYYLIYVFFGPEAGLMPPGYLTGILAGAAVFYIAGAMASFATWMNFPEKFGILFDHQDLYQEKEIISLCVYFSFYALSLWALTSFL